MKEQIKPRRNITIPVVTIYPSGVVYLNAAAYRALGSPRYLAVYRAGEELEFHPHPSAEDAYTVISVGQGATFTCRHLARLKERRAKLFAEVRDGVLHTML